MKIEGAIFDLDGTLLDSMPVWNRIGAEYLRAQGLEPRPELREETRAMSLQQTADYFRGVYGLALSRQEIMDGVNAMLLDYYTNEAPPKGDIIPFLQRLREKGVKMCVATATDRKLVEAGLQRNGMLDFFQEIVTCIELDAGKDRPDVFLEAMRRMGTPLETTVVFEDALYAARTAKLAGFPVVAIREHYSQVHAEALQEIADVYIRNYAELEME